MNQKYIAQKAEHLDDIPSATVLNEPVGPDHPFFTDFSDLRGVKFKENLYDNLNITHRAGKPYFDYEKSTYHKVILFLGGMRGSGKTSELLKISKDLGNPNCFYPIYCNLEDLDLNHLEYMDFLVFQTEQTLIQLQEDKIEVNQNTLTSLNEWYTTVTNETGTKKETGHELEGNAGIGGGLLGLVKLTGSVKKSLKGSEQTAETMRTVLKNNFDVYAQLFNRFVEEVNIALRKSNKAHELLFIIDGLEKTNEAATRRRIIIDERNRIEKIKAYTILTLPIELMSERQRLEHFAKIISFPFIKTLTPEGEIVQQSIDRLVEFVDKRIARSLFSSEEVVKRAAVLSGGSPRELLRLLQAMKTYAATETGVLDEQALEEAAYRLGTQLGLYLNKKELELLKTLKNNLEQGLEMEYDEVVFFKLLEDRLIFEYNDGTYKREHPLLHYSKLYQQQVLGQLPKKQSGDAAIA